MTHTKQNSRIILIVVCALLLVQSVACAAARKKEPKTWFQWFTGHTWGVVAKLVNVQGRADAVKTGKLMQCSIKTGAAVILWDPPGGCWSPAPVGQNGTDVAVLRPGGATDDQSGGIWTYQTRTHEGKLVVSPDKLPANTSFDSLVRVRPSGPLLAILRDNAADSNRYLLREVDLRSGALRQPEGSDPENCVLDESGRTMLIQASRIRGNRALQVEKPVGQFMYVRLRQRNGDEWPGYSKIAISGYHGDFFDPAWLSEEEIVLVYSPP